MSDSILYFGYGANRDAKMLALFLDRPETAMQGVPAVLKGYKLIVQRLDQVPTTISDTAPVKISPQALLRESWDDDFCSYLITPDPTSSVSGIVWQLTPDERERVRDWEMIDFGWYEDCEVEVTLDDGRSIRAITERLGAGQSYDHEVDGLNYKTWLNRIEDFTRSAEKAKREYNARIR